LANTGVSGEPNIQSSIARAPDSTASTVPRVRRLQNREGGFIALGVRDRGPKSAGDSEGQAAAEALALL
jgi:hypothetical protein